MQQNHLELLAQQKSTKYRSPEAVAQIPLLKLEWVWFYVAGTLCNLECAHCLVNAGPDSRVLIPLEMEEFIKALEEVKRLNHDQTFHIGFTGGEVFLLKSKKFGHRLFDMVETALQYGDLLILTNGLLADDKTLATLKEIEQAASHTISYRISLDGPTAEENDAIRYFRNKKGTLRLIMESLQRFVNHGFLPAIAYTYEGSGKPQEVLQRKANLEARYRKLLKEWGLHELELWGLPFFDQGYETTRREKLGLAHINSPGITNHCIATYTGHGYHLFQCSYSRSFGKELTGECGWYKCAVLPARAIDPNAFLSNNLKDALDDILLDHPSCFTCFTAATQGIGMSCSGKIN